MKKILLTIIAICAITFGYTQQVDREKVIVEIKTGTWCQYCPAAANGADELVENGHDVAIIEYHGGDDYENSYSTARINYYGSSGYPTAYFDGVLNYVGGGGASQSNYNIYLNRVNSRLNIQSSFTLDLEGSNSGLTDYDVSVTVEKVASAGSNLVLHAVLTESHIEENWQGMSELNFVERLMIPNQYGTPLDFSGGDVQEINISFTLDDDWVSEHCELVVFIQDPSSKEIKQATKASLEEFGTNNLYDIAIMELAGVGENNCTGKWSPILTVRNNGLENLTEFVVSYYVNDGEIQTYAWGGDLAYMESNEFMLDEITFDVLPQNMMKVYTSAPNGQTDQYPKNDTTIVNFVQAESTKHIIKLNMRLDGAPEETMYEILDSDGTVVFTDGPWPGEPNKFLNETFELESNKCYSFILYDDGGNGICCDNGVGFYHLQDIEGLVLKQGGEFGSMEITQFETTIGVGTEEILKQAEIDVFPNPFTSELNINVELQTEEPVKVEVYNLLGEKVYRKNMGILSRGIHTLSLDNIQTETGIYFLKMEIGNRQITRKISKTL